MTTPTAERRIYRYRSPYRPLDHSWLPKDIAESMVIYKDGPWPTWSPTLVYEFVLPIPDRFVEQWSLVVIQ